jgi:8-oxo-dGTP pyrophosphatase MutT (NUDIX family)
MEDDRLNHRSAGGIVFRLQSEIPEFLALHQVRANGEEQWVMPKGHAEDAETSEETARREIQEEVGLKLIQNIGFVGTEKYQYVEADGILNRKSVDWFLFLADSLEHPAPREEEGFDHFLWLQYGNARLKYSHEDVLEFLDRAYEMALNWKAKNH